MKRWLSHAANGLFIFALFALAVAVNDRGGVLRAPNVLDIGREFIEPVKRAGASQGSCVMPTTGTVSGLTLVQDINACVQAILSSNSGASAPANGAGSAAETGQMWLDTSTTPNGVRMYDGASWVVIGYVDASNHYWTPPVGGGTGTVVSASTADLWSVRQAYVSVTGTTGITALANASAVPGTIKVVRFTGALTLTHNGTSLILPTAANITTAAGDSAIVLALTATNVAVVGYTRADGTALGAGANFQGAVSLNSTIAPTALAADTNDWAPTSLATSNVIRFSCSSVISITGITAPGVAGTVLVLHNIGTTNQCNLTNQDSNSSAANRFILPALVTVRPLESVTIIYDSTSARWRLQTPVRAPPVAAGFKFLRIFNVATPYGDSAPGTPNNQMSLKADALTLEDATGIAYRAQTVSLTIDVTSSGANGLDTGSVSSSTDYYIWAIYNPATNTVAGLFSTSSTAPTMPSGYTFKARYGWNRTDGSSHFYRVLQSGRVGQYVVGTNPAVVRNIANGSAGTFDPTTPTLTTASVSGLVPATAGRIHLMLTVDWKNSSANAMAAPSTAWGGTNNGPRGSNGNTYPLFIIFPTGGNGETSMSAWLNLEASTVAWASSGAGGALQCLGWEDNI